jgi:hypothetical protein
MLANSEPYWAWVEEGITGTETIELWLQIPTYAGIVRTPEGLRLPPAYDWMGRRTFPAGVHVHNMNWDIELKARTNITGVFSLAVPPDVYGIRAHPLGRNLEGMFTKSLPGEFVVQEPLPRQPNPDLPEFRLTYPRIEGWVLQENAVGEWLPVNTYVDIWEHEGPYWDSDETGIRADGGIDPFRFGGIPEGMYSAQSGAPYEDPLAGLSNIYDFEVVPGSQYQITATEWVTLYIGGEYGANVIGKVLHPVDIDGDGVVDEDWPVQWADVRLKWPNPDDPDWPFEEWTQADGEGRFAFYGLDAGIDYAVQAFPPMGMAMEWDPSRPVDFRLASADELFTTTLKLRPAFRPKTVTGTVMYASDPFTPVEDATVYAFNDETGVWLETWSDQDGFYELKLKGGLWWVGVQPYPDADWFFDPAWEVPVEFSRTAELESEVVDLYVRRFRDMEDFVEVMGRVETPAGDPAPDGTWVEVCNDATGECFGGETQLGDFNFWAPIGFYFLGIYPDPESGFLPPLRNGDIEVEITADPTDLGVFVLRKKIPAKVQGQVVDAGTGNGVRGVPIEAWTEDGDFAMTKTGANGYYTITLSPGYWRGGPVLTGTLAQNYVVLPPQRRGGLLTKDGATGQDFRISRLNATIKGRVVDIETSSIISDVNAVVFVETCSDRGCVGTEVDVFDGEYSVRVVGGYTYTVDIWAERYMPGPDIPVMDVYVAANGSQTVNLGLLEAGTRIHGYLMDSDLNPVKIHAGVDGTAPAAAYGAQSDAWFWVSDALWPEKDPYKFNLYVPTPENDPVTWDLSLLVDPRNSYAGIHYIAAPGYSYDTTIDPGETEKPVIMYVKELETFITGTLHLPNGDPAPYIPVFAEPTTITDSEGLIFEGESDKDGNFKIPVLPGEEYEVGAFLPPKFKQLGLLPPIPVPWVGLVDNPVMLKFRRLGVGPGGLTISGRIAVSPTGALTTGMPVHVLGWSSGGAASEVTSTVGGLYHMPVVSDTVWHVWAVHEGDALYYSQEKIVEVAATSVLGQDLTLAYAFDLPDDQCWTVTTNGDLLQFPRRSDLLPPVLWVKPGTFEQDVEICVEPTAALPDGPRLIGFAYDLTARDSMGRKLGEDDFKQKMRLSFYYTSEVLNSLPIDPGYNAPEPNNLTPVYFSTIKNDWVPLDDPMVDEEDMFVTGKLDHFTSFGLMGTTPAEEAAAGYSVYLPLVLRQ